MIKNRCHILIYIYIYIYEYYARAMNNLINNHVQTKENKKIFFNLIKRK